MVRLQQKVAALVADDAHSTCCIDTLLCNCAGAIQSCTQLHHVTSVFIACIRSRAACQFAPPSWHQLKCTV